MIFAEALAKGISDNPGISPYWAGEVTKILNAPDSLRKRLILRRFESHATAHLQDDPDTPRDATGAIDWANVDWAKVLTTLLKILVVVLSIIPLV
jgi:hypothetical protein